MSDPAHEATDKAIKELEGTLFDAYNEATESMLKKQEKAMAEYERMNNELKVQLAENQITKEQYKKFLEQKAVATQWYNDMVQTLAYDAMMADKNAVAIINGQLPDTYATNFNYGTYEVEKASRINTAFTLYDRDTVNRLLKDQNLFAFASLDEGKDLVWNRQKLASALMQGVLQGESIPDIAERLARVMDMDYNTAKRTARTCMTGAENAGRIDSYDRAQSLGIMGQKRWLATLDDRTRDSHAELDGVAVDIHEKFSNDLEYPGDMSGDPSEYMNCRCTLIYQMEETRYDDADRDNRLGKVSFEEWMEAH